MMTLEFLILITHLALGFLSANREYLVLGYYRPKLLNLPLEELGLTNFMHIHNAVLRQIGKKFYLIAQAWNPGDFTVLEQVQ